jgi:5'-3' exonuclease
VWRTLTRGSEDRLGPITAFKYIQKYGTIESALLNEPKHSPPQLEEYLATVQIARDIFLNLPPLPNEITSLIQQREKSPDLALLLSEWGIDIERPWVYLQPPSTYAEEDVLLPRTFFESQAEDIRFVEEEADFGPFDLRELVSDVGEYEIDEGEAIDEGLLTLAEKHAEAFPP